MTHRSILSVSALCVLTFGAQGCDDVAWNFEIQGYPVSIGGPDRRIYDPAIIGVWERKNEDSDSVASLVIETNDMQTYQVAIYEDTNSEPAKGEAFAVEVDGVRFLNMRLDDIPGFLFLRYAAHSDNLTVWGFEEAPDEVPDEAPNTAEDLLAWITLRVHDEEFYAEPENYTRVELWGRCLTHS